MKLGALIDIISFIQMIYILFELSNVPRVGHILFKLT